MEPLYFTINPQVQKKFNRIYTDNDVAKCKWTVYFFSHLPIMSYHVLSVKFFNQKILYLYLINKVLQLVLYICLCQHVICLIPRSSGNENMFIRTELLSSNGFLFKQSSIIHIIFLGKYHFFFVEKQKDYFYFEDIFKKKIKKKIVHFKHLMFNKSCCIYIFNPICYYIKTL